MELMEGIQKLLTLTPSQMRSVLQNNVHTGNIGSLHYVESIPSEVKPNQTHIAVGDHHTCGFFFPTA